MTPAGHSESPQMPARFTSYDKAQTQTWVTETYCRRAFFCAEVMKTEDGTEYLGITRGRAGGSFAFIVSPVHHRRQFRLENGQGKLVGTYGTCRRALEAICLTRYDAGAPRVAAAAVPAAA